MKTISYKTTILTLSVVLNACGYKTNLNDLISCDYNNEFKHTKVVTDVKNNYQINVGENWKTELYFDNHQSRIYSADTTRGYTESFIIDATRFDTNIIISKAFKEKISSEIKKKPRSYVLKEGFTKFNEQPCYYIYSFQKTNKTVLYNIQCYVAYQGYYFLLSSKINGNKKLAENTCESIAIFNSLTQMLNNKS